MAATSLPDNKLMSLVLNGYNPFQPECGIFCGGYQGLLYPNPTTLVYPGFNPYLYTNPTASEYMPDILYPGLGVGNPGIDYKNPGHILGLLDTFARMSYGINILRAIHTGGGGGGGIGPAVNISIPCMDATGSATTLEINDIYPSLCEIPSDWLDGFMNWGDGTIEPDPRPLISFNTQEVGHVPTLNSVNAEQLNRLFANKSIFSYLGMPQYLRTIIESLGSAAASLASKASFEFRLDSPHYFDNYSHQDQYGEFPSIDDLEHHNLSEEGVFMHHCKTLSSSESLKVLTGEDNYHDGQNGQNEYRSLTELNSVINIVPIHTVGATYWLDDHIPLLNPDGTVHSLDDQTPRNFHAASIMISDLIINVSDVPSSDDPEPGTVTIDGRVIVRSIVTNVTEYHLWSKQRLFKWPPPGDIVEKTYGNLQFLRKTANIIMSMTNQYTWDRTWLDVGLINDGDSFYENISQQTTGGDSDTGFDYLDQSDLVTSFSKTFTLAPGCNSIRMRIFGRNSHTIGQDTPPLVAEDHWVTEESETPGTIEQRYSGDPDKVPLDMEKANIRIIFTVTGTKFDPIEYEVALGDDE